MRRRSSLPVQPLIQQPGTPKTPLRAFDERLERSHMVDGHHAWQPPVDNVRVTVLRRRLRQSVQAGLRGPANSCPLEHDWDFRRFFDLDRATPYKAILAEEGEK